MVKTLKRKFIFASMLAVTILLVTLVGAINILYCYSVYRQEKTRLELFCETDGMPEGPSEPGDPLRDNRSNQLLMKNKQKDIFRRHMTMDEALSTRFFTVWFDESGEIILTDTSRIYAVTDEGARQMAQEMRSQGKNTGLYQGFRYLFTDKKSSSSDTSQEEAQPEPGREDGAAADSVFSGELQTQQAQIRQAAGVLVAMDISADRKNMLRILGISALIAVLCWLIMLLPVNALAARAIAPTALSIERQKQFVTNAGHELKTPLAIIQANTDALELYNGESKWTRNIRAQTVRLNGLMQNLLTLSRMDEDSLKLEKEVFAVDPLIQEVWDNFAEPAAGRKISVRIMPDDSGEQSVCANRESLAQLLSILFDNAVKYTPRGGEIEVRTCAEAEEVRIIQSNTLSAEGKTAVIPEDADRLFERFYRADSDRSRKKGGYGIGLSAARAIAGANGGKISASAENGRIVFTLTLKKGSV